MENSLYQVRLRNITAGFEVSPDGVVVSAAPVFEKFIGARFDNLRKWVIQKGGSVYAVNREGRHVRNL